MAQNRQKKILYVATVVKTHIMHFHLPYLKMLHEDGWQVDVAARNDYETPAECNIPNCDNYYDIRFERNPFSLKNIKAYNELKKIIDDGNYDIVHCHTPVAGVLTRLAARSARKAGTKVIYTAHGFQFYRGGSKRDWMLFYPVEKFCSKLTDVLITINDEDYKLAKEKFTKCPDVEFVSGVGIDTERFKNTDIDFSKKRQSLGLKKEDWVILSVGELTKRKNQIDILRALNELNDKDNIKYLMVGDGENRNELETYIRNNKLENCVNMLGYRNDVAELYKISDLFIMSSIREGLPVALMEAIASGTAVVASDTRGNRDLVSKEDLYNAGDYYTLSKIINSKIGKANTENGRMTDKYDICSIKKNMRDIYN